MPLKHPSGPVAADEKWCFQCSTALPFSRFSREPRKPDGYCPACHKCRARKRRERQVILGILEDTATCIMARRGHG